MGAEVREPRTDDVITMGRVGIDIYPQQAGIGLEQRSPSPSAAAPRTSPSLPLATVMLPMRVAPARMGESSYVR